MKKLWETVYAFMFFCLLLLPIAWMPFAKEASTENRVLAEMPSVTVDGRINAKYFSQVDAFFQDHFAFRSTMVNAFGHLMTDVFHESPNDKVIVGKNGWLYFSETLGDYDGSTRLSDAEIRRIALVLRQMGQSSGAVFLVAIAPNKNTLYPQYMPDSFRKTALPSNLERLYMYEGIDFVDLRPVLTGNDPLYYRTDTHWNARGARAAAKAIMEAITERTGAYVQRDWQNAPYTQSFRTGDLARMIYPYATGEADVVFSDTSQEFVTVGRYKSPEDINIVTSGGSVGLRVFMLRDSFANALLPYFSNGYSDVAYTRQMPFPLNAAMDSDIIVLEIAERRLPELLNAAPVGRAASAKPFDVSKISGQAFASVLQTQQGTRLWGYAPGCVDNLKDVTVMLVDAQERIAFTAYPVLERELVQTAGISVAKDREEGAFSLLLDPAIYGDFTLYAMQQGSTNAVYEATVHIPK